MARYKRFTFLCDANERRAIANLAMQLSRSQSDAVRFVVIEAARQLSQVQADSTIAQSMLVQEINQEGMHVTE